MNPKNLKQFRHKRKTEKIMKNGNVKKRVKKPYDWFAQIALTIPELKRWENIENAKRQQLVAFCNQPNITKRKIRTNLIDFDGQVVTITGIVVDIEFHDGNADLLLGVPAIREDQHGNKVFKIFDSHIWIRLNYIHWQCYGTKERPIYISIGETIEFKGQIVQYKGKTRNGVRGWRMGVQPLCIEYSGMLVKASKDQRVEKYLTDYPRHGNWVAKFDNLPYCDFNDDKKMLTKPPTKIVKEFKPSSYLGYREMLAYGKEDNAKKIQ